MTTQTHLSFKVSKRLKEFLGDSAPEPIGDLYHISKGNPCLQKGGSGLPAYRLEDLLSKPFCEAMAWKIRGGYAQSPFTPLWVAEKLCGAYYGGGMEAVEKALTEMMGGT